ncbi:hypothetical protein [Pacificoceanicola onchidii]|uniref:hypothetical protein n=1 Tax=Pacificoceanicola onchidii TaxID=2562685 RepID=UPI0010A65386|nr:hypothetical protein [Pacificoceanicola onchidii]
MKVKHSVTRLLFEDTSGGSFPSVDWLFEVNGQTSSEGNFFAIRNADDDKPLLHLNAAAPADAIHLNAQGDLGLGTSLPTTDLHLVDNMDPGIAFETVSSGQRWELHGNGAGFYLFDPGTGSLPLEIRTGAPDHGLFMDSVGNTGFGTGAPSAAIHVLRGDGSAGLRVENTSGSPSAVREMFNMTNNGGSYFTLDNSQAGTSWYFVHENNAPNRFIISDSVPDGPEMSLTASGHLSVQGGFQVAGTQLNVPDYVFESDYPLRSLDEVSAFIAENGHLPEIPSAADVNANGLDMTQMQLLLLKKIEELTLYTLEQEAVIRRQEARLRAQDHELSAIVAALNGRFADLETAIQQ